MNHLTASWVSCVSYESISWAHKIWLESVSNSASYMNQLHESNERNQVSYVSVTQLSAEAYFIASPDRLVTKTNDSCFTHSPDSQTSHKSPKWLMIQSTVNWRRNWFTIWAKAQSPVNSLTNPGLTRQLTHDSIMFLTAQTYTKEQGVIFKSPLLAERWTASYRNRLPLLKKVQMTRFRREGWSCGWG